MERIPSLPPASTLPHRAGIGLKPQHYADVLGKDGDATGPSPAWVEVHPQNYFADGGPAHRWLEAVARDYPISFHSTGLSLGSADGPNRRDLRALSELVNRYSPAQVSDHLSWSDCGNEQFPDLLPMPYTLEALDLMADNIDLVQNALRRQILVENPSRYLCFAEQDMDEAGFISALCRRTGCGALLDLNNIVVSATNLGLDPQAVMETHDFELVGEIHLAGHKTESHGALELAIDDHGSAVGDACWDLFERFVASAGARPTLIEWDTDVPAFEVLMAEVCRADALLEAPEVLRAVA